MHLCRVITNQRSATGKHGHAKARIDYWDFGPIGTIS
jgi:hypothetical protein